MSHHSDQEEASKPPATKKMKQQDAAVVKSIIHGSFNYSEIDSFSFLVPATDADRVLAALVQSTKQHHTWTIVPDETIDAELVSKIPACLAHPVGTLSESFLLEENQQETTEEELLDLILTGRAGLIAKKHDILYIVDGKDTEEKHIIPPIDVANEQQCIMQVQQAAEKLYDVDGAGGESLYISHVAVWNHSEFQINIAGMRNQHYRVYHVEDSLKFTDEWVTTLVSMGSTQEEDEDLDIDVHRLLREIC